MRINKVEQHDAMLQLSGVEGTIVLVGQIDMLKIDEKAAG